VPVGVTLSGNGSADVDANIVFKGSEGTQKLVLSGGDTLQGITLDNVRLQANTTPGQGPNVLKLVRITIPSAT
jgi:hypothetical protein